MFDCIDKLSQENRLIYRDEGRLSDISNGLNGPCFDTTRGTHSINLNLLFVIRNKSFDSERLNSLGTYPPRGHGCIICNMTL